MNGVFLEEVLREDRNLLAALAQRRQVDRHDVEPEEQILAELSFGDGLLDIAVGGRNDAYVDAHVVLAAEARELAVLEHLQQLGLQRKAHVSDLVEEHRAVVGELELARLVLDRAGERAALEPEQLRLEQLGGQRGAIHLDERPVAAERGGIERPRDKLLADAALAAHEHGDVGVGDAIDQLADFGHLLAVAEEQVVLLLRLQLLAQRGDLSTELPLLQRVGERHLEIGCVEWLAHEIRSAELHRLHDRCRASLTRDDDDGDLAIDLLQSRERLESVHRAGDHDVENHGGRPLRVVPLDRLFGAADSDRGIATVGEERSQEVTHRHIVVHDHDLGFAVEIHKRHVGRIQQWQCHCGKLVV